MWIDKGTLKYAMYNFDRIELPGNGKHPGILFKKRHSIKIPGIKGIFIRKSKRELLDGKDIPVMGHTDSGLSGESDFSVDTMKLVIRHAVNSGSSIIDSSMVLSNQFRTNWVEPVFAIIFLAVTTSFT